MRVDTGVTTGDEVSVYYDPLIAKLIVHAEDRRRGHPQDAGCARATRCCSGITTNWRFLQDVLDHPAFSGGRVHTAWIDRSSAAGRRRSASCRPEVLVAAALSEAQILHGAGGATVDAVRRRSGRGRSL